MRHYQHDTMSSWLADPDLDLGAKNQTESPGHKPNLRQDLPFRRAMARLENPRANNGGAMLDNSWAFLKDPANRAVLGWICGGIAALAGGVWAVIKFLSNKGEDRHLPPIRADKGSVAIGHDSNAPINIDTRHSGKR